MDDTPALVQHVNIYVEEGKTRTEVFPTNEDLLEKSKTEPPIGRVFRSIHFFDGVPPEYLWVRGVETRWRGPGPDIRGVAGADGTGEAER